MESERLVLALTFSMAAIVQESVEQEEFFQLLNFADIA